MPAGNATHSTVSERQMKLFSVESQWRFLPVNLEQSQSPGPSIGATPNGLPAYFSRIAHHDREFGEASRGSGQDSVKISSLSSSAWPQSCCDNFCIDGENDPLLANFTLCECLSSSVIPITVKLYRFF